MSTKTFTPEQIANWHSYEFVRSTGIYNMLTSQAIRASGLSKRDYFFALENYDALREAAQAAQGAAA